MRWTGVAILGCALALGQGLRPRAALGQTADASPTRVRAAGILSDLPVLERKYLALAEAFSDEQYDWRPADGVRSVREVLYLIIAENGALLPRTFGRPGIKGLGGDLPRVLRDLGSSARTRPELLGLLRQSFAVASQTWGSLSEADLGASYAFFGTRRSGTEIAWATSTDQHEHLGQLVAYARMNGVTPPWSRAAP
jgi:DinB superfamily